MRTVHKFRLSSKRTQIFELPTGYRILSVQLQSNVPHMWVFLNPDKSTSKTTLKIYADEDEIASDEKLRFINTFQHGAAVWHIFEHLNAEHEETNENTEKGDN